MIWATLLRESLPGGLVRLESPPCGLQAPDACHHRWYGPEGKLRGAVQKTADSPQLQFFEGRRYFLFVVQRPIPMVLTVQLTMEIPQLFLDIWSMSLFDRASSTGAGCGGDSRAPTVAAC